MVQPNIKPQPTTFLILPITNKNRLITKQINNVYIDEVTTEEYYVSTGEVGGDM